MSAFFELIRSVPAPFNMVVLIVLFVTLGGIISSAFKEIRKYACHRQEMEFKRELLDRGLTIDEVEQLVRARSNSKSSNY